MVIVCILYKPTVVMIIVSILYKATVFISPGQFNNSCR